MELSARGTGQYNTLLFPGIYLIVTYVCDVFKDLSTSPVFMKKKKQKKKKPNQTNNLVLSSAMSSIL